MNYTEHQKLIVPIRYWLIGLAAADSSYNKVIHALDFFARIHEHETRKNGARGFYHQLSILAFLRNFHKLLPDPVAVYITILGHDAYEDYQEVHGIAIRDAFPDHFQYIRRISKIREGKKLTNDEYYGELASCLVCAIAKGGDRIHNLSTMADPGAFSIAKQVKYIEETRAYVLPMLKSVRVAFPEIEPICEALKSVLLIECSITENLHKRIDAMSNVIGS